MTEKQRRKADLLAWKKNLKKKNDLPKKTYAEFLKSNYWKRVRKKVLKRDNYKCYICGSEDRLNVHHGTYAHYRMEHKHLSDLVTLCESCHKKEHGLIPIV